MGTQTLIVTSRKRRRERFRLALLPVFLLAGFAVAVIPARAQNFTASLDRDPITLGESATLSLTFEGGQPKDVPSMPPLQGVRVTYGGQSSQFSFVNGRTTSSVSRNFSLTPTRPGEIDIPSIQAEVNGKVLASRPLKLRVLKPNEPPPEAVESGSQIAFLKLVLPKKEVTLGEIITAQLQFYFRQGVQLARPPQLTALPVDGFTVGKNAEGQQRQVQIGNAIYSVWPFGTALTAVKTGPLTVGPVTANIVIQVPSSRRQRDPFFERFGFRDFFDTFGFEQKQVPVASAEETVQSLPLPTENVPPSFNGAVGNYSLDVSVGPTNVAVGDPITVKVQITGRGALDLLSLPDQPAWRDFKSFSATTKTEPAGPLSIQGTKSFEQVLVPQNADIKELPAFAFSFFDPESKAYRTLTHGAVPLIVRPAGSTPLPMMARTIKAEEKPSAQDIIPIKQRLGTTAPIEPPLVQQPWFLGLQAAPVLAWLGLFAWRKRTDLLAHNPRLRRQRQVTQIVREGVRRLRQLAVENKSDDFFVTLFRLIQEQLGERLDLPASAITEAVVEERLRPQGLPEPTQHAVHELFQMCNVARYAPVKTSRELAAIIPKLEAVLRELRNWNS